MTRRFPLPSAAIAALAGAALLPALAPSIAGADVASSDGATIWVRGDDRNETIVLSMTSSGEVEINSDETGPGCTRTIFESTRCPLGPGGVVVAMAGGSDKVTSLMLTEGMLPDGALQVDLGAGDDRFTGADSAETIVAGPGNDTIETAGGDDSIDGGEGNDTINGGGGRDTLRAGPGDDVLDGDAYATPAADTIDGGEGNDKAVGWNIPDGDLHPPVTVTLNGAADDGRPGEGDNVAGIERITSHVSGTIALSDAPDVVEMWANQDHGNSTIATLGGNDTVTGGNSSETIDGGAGDDRLEGGFGDDTIVGGAGRDTIVGDKSASQCGLFESCSMPIGNDTIDVRDGVADSVSCGVGTDRVIADAADTIAPDCETVERPAVVAPPRAETPRDSTPRGTAPRGGSADGKARLTAAGSVRLGSALARGIKVRVAGIKKGSRVVFTARAGKRTVARGAARVGRGGTATVTLRFTPAARRSLRRARSVKLTVAGSGARALVLTLHR
ncbi:calcium-binding protein [Conexibacter stalactiti]|uniref:Calcium-binding protein n=1 Tax=Conexibacter stalactiti TaxID=1940611 RepID=A0ABU4HX52_9ACTN|nr:calcium-binding protein [Conexibacter stalactiti]MDW5597247.1 calcium-binding protein [Conexibacter stalactiti]MEC5037889.1 calcium-binding protein [Conexibacter stalactiti]